MTGKFPRTGKGRTTFIGLDPGLDGGMAAIFHMKDPKKLVHVIKVVPTLKKTVGKGKRVYNVEAMAHWFIKFGHRRMLVILEKQQAMPKQGVSSMFLIGRGFGLWQGILAGMGLPYRIVHPKRWQKQVFDDSEGVTKERSVMACQRFSPGIDLTATPRSHKPHSGMADALCMAMYGYQIWGSD